MMIKQAGLVLLVLGMLTARVFAADVTVNVNPESTVTGGQMLVGNLAVVSGVDPDKVQTVRQLNLGNSPPPGGRLVLTADMVAARLVDAGADFSQVFWQIPPIVTVVTEGQTICGQSIKEIAEKAIKERLGVHPGDETRDVTVTSASAQRDMMVPVGKVDLRAELPYGIRLITPTIVNVIIHTDGRYFSTTSLKFDVKIWQKVLVANRNIAPLEVLTDDNVRLERWDISRLTSFVTDPGKVAGLRTRRSFAAGAPICETALEKLPLVKRGGGVTIVAQTKGITVTASGQALQSGCQGAIIRVQNLTSNRIVNARVIDEKTVEVIIYSGR